MDYIILIFAVIALYQLYQFLKWRSVQLDFSGKVVFLTGGSSGIGEELTKKFIALGAKKVIIASRNVAEMERVKKESGAPSKVEILQMDLNKPDECLEITKTFVSRADVQSEGIDVLVNNAGVTMRQQFVNFDFATCQMMMNTNCMSHIAITKAFLPLLIKQKRGKIVNVISVAGLIGTGFRTMYSSAKYGIAGFFKALRFEVQQHGIEITNIYPEFVKTAISKNAHMGSGKTFGKTDTNIQKGIPVEKAVETMLKAVQLGERELIVGRALYHVVPHLCFWSSAINRVVGKIAYKQSLKSIAEAE